METQFFSQSNRRQSGCIAKLLDGRRTFGGKISDVKLFSKDLSPAEIKKIYENSKKEYR